MARSSHRARSRRECSSWLKPVVVLCAGTVLLAVAVHAEPLFQDSHSFSTGQYPYAVAAADLDGDGRVDLVTANRGAGSLSVLRGLGGGQFAPHVDLPTGVAPSAVAIADVNADGRLDLIAANSAGGTVSVLLGAGGATFQPQREFRAGIGSSRVVVADLDGDGRADLATLNGGANSLAVLHGNGDGSFAEPRPHATGLSPAALAAGDLDGDQRTDLVVTNQFGAPLSVFRSLADGTLAPRRDVPFLALNPSAVVLADMNGDAVLDAVVASTGFDVVSILHGVGDGSFGAIHELAIGLGPYAIVAQDLDADGRTDIGVANIFSSTVAVQRQLTADQYAEDGFLVGGEYPADVIAVDVNQDGRPDLVSANNLSNTVSVFLSRTTAVSMQFRLAHDRLDLHSGDDRITAYLQPPAPFRPEDIEVASIRINDTVPVLTAHGRTVEDRDHDGIPELRLRFERRALLATLSSGAEAVVRVSGRVGGRDFAGADTVRVRRHHDDERRRGGHESHAAGLGAGGAAPDLRVVAVEAHGRLVLELTVPTGGRARLEMLDVAGRRLATREVDSRMSGLQRVEWPEAGAHAPGLYFVRLLTDREASVTRRVVRTE